MKNPINYAYGVEINSHANRVALLGIAASIGCHYLGNRFVWQIASGAELLKTRLCQDVACLLLDRVISNSEWVGRNRREMELDKLFFLIPFIPYAFLCEPAISQIDALWIMVKFKAHAVLMGAPSLIAIGHFAQKRWGSPGQLKLYRTTLGVTKEATPAEIKKAYFTLSKTAHPDRGGSEEQFKLLKKAHEALSDPKSWEEEKKLLDENLDKDNLFHSLSAFWLFDSAYLLSLGVASAAETGSSKVSQPEALPTPMKEIPQTPSSTELDLD